MPESDPLWRAHAELHEAHDKMHDRERLAQQAAVDKAETALGARLANLNEWRGQSRDEQARFVTRDVFEALKERVDRAEGAVNTWRWIAGFLGVSGMGAIVWAIVSRP